MVAIRMLLILLLMTLACNSTVRHPNAPMLITGVSFGKVEVSVYDAENNRLIEAGTVSPSDLVGRTVSIYDWEAYIRSK